MSDAARIAASTAPYPPLACQISAAIKGAAAYMMFIGATSEPFTEP